MPFPSTLSAADPSGTYGAWSGTAKPSLTSNRSPHTATTLAATAALAIAGFGASGTMSLSSYFGDIYPYQPPTSKVSRTRLERRLWAGEEDKIEQRAAGKVATSTSELLRAITRVFGQVAVRETLRTDPDEGWTRTWLTVQTGIEDIDARMEAEDRLYSIADEEPTLSEAFRYIVVSFL